MTTTAARVPRMGRDPGSFRDPSGGVLHQDGRVFRFFTEAAAPDFRKLLNSPLIAELEQLGAIVGTRVVDRSLEPELYDDAAHAATRSDVALLVEHPRVPFLSYPYDWPFEMLRAAAIAQLDILEAALEKGYILKDSTPYNIQFQGCRSVFIDIASFEPYEEGQPWNGYSQFCRMFLNPLLLQSLRGVPFQPWLRQSLDGIDPALLTRLLGLKNKFRPTVFIHVVLQAMLNRRLSGSVSGSPRRIPRSATLGLVRGLRGAIQKLRRPGTSVTTWLGYEDNLPYASEALDEKKRFVQSVVAAHRPGIAWDLGCNRGLFTELIAPHCEQVVAMDFDEATVGAFYESVRDKHANVLPLVVDLTNPDPDQGWAQAERAGLAARGPADFVLALALVHHLSISANVPLPRIVDWLATVTRAGVVEFVPRSDPMVQRLLATRKDVYPDYHEEAFAQALASRFHIEERRELPGSGRTLYAFSSR